MKNKVRTYQIDERYDAIAEDTEHDFEKACSFWFYDKTLNCKRQTHVMTISEIMDFHSNESLENAIKLCAIDLAEEEIDYLKYMESASDESFQMFDYKD